MRREVAVNKLLYVTRCGQACWFFSGSLPRLRHVAAAAAVALAPGLAAIHASTISGTLSNFDTYNATPEPSEGAESELEDLVSGNAMVPEDSVEVETEWELLEGGKAPKVKEDQVQDTDKLIIRRYEFFEYTGPVTDENEPDFVFLDQDDIDPSNVG